ncbi:MAG: sigma-70 family RNA polymerase sigma factor [Clostridia bacterium]|nr:sigma-70 family RNA polymerase sigma factor [Clostridia bacterium]
METNKLISEYFEKEELNIRKIVNEYSKYTYTVIENTSRNILNTDDIEELISDVFLAIWKNKEKLEVNSPIKPYIAGIARNLTYNKLRTIKIYSFESIEENDNLYYDDVQMIVESNEKFKIIEEVLKEDEENSKIFTMFYYQSKKVKEIAENLKQTEFNIYKKLHRIRKKIKCKLEERGYSYGK